MITFKKQPREAGRIGHHYSCINIKHRRRECGVIYAPSWLPPSWKVSFTVIDPRYSIGWCWVVVGSYETESEARDAAKEWARLNVERLYVSDNLLRFRIGG